MIDESLHDLAETTIPASEQWTAQELYNRDLVIRITEAKVIRGDKQSLHIFFHGDGGRPFKPCLTMRVIIVAAWGDSSATLVGRRLHLFRDPTAPWGGQEVGGIRIKRMSHLKAPLIIPLRKKRGVIAPYKVDVLPDEEPDTFPIDAVAPAPPLDVDLMKAAATEAALRGLGPLGDYWKSIGGARQRLLQPHIEEIKQLAPDYQPAVVTGEPQNAP